MAQVLDILQDALQYLGVQDPDSALSPEDEKSGIRQLNMMMRRWEADGLSMGWVDATEGADVLTAPAECEEAIGYNLALRLQARYGISPARLEYVASKAREGYNTLLRDQEVATPLVARTDLPTPESWNITPWRQGWDY
jgi:hypothetical protein